MDLEQLHSIFYEYTGVAQFPQTVYSRLATHYKRTASGNFIIRMTNAKKWKPMSDYPEFFWFHEVFHFYEDIAGLWFSNRTEEEQKISPESTEYFYITSEIYANIFAYILCKIHGFKIPNWYPDGYFAEYEHVIKFSEQREQRVILGELNA